MVNEIPNSADAEASLIGAMLLVDDAILDATETLKASDFYSPVNQAIFAAIMDIWKQGKSVDVVTVSENLKSSGLPEKAISAGALMSLTAGTPAATNSAHYCAIVKDTSLLRQLIAAGGAVQELGYSRPDDVDQAIEVAEAEVFKIAQGNAKDTLQPVSAVVGSTLDELEELFDSDETNTGLGTGFVDLDRMTGGLQKSTLVVLGARPAMGKTALALNIVAHAAFVERKTVAVFSLEMSKSELLKRLISADSGVDSSKMRDGSFKDGDWDRLSKSFTKVGKSDIHLDDDPALSVSTIRAKCRKLKARHGALDLVVIDYLQLCSSSGKAENRQVEVSEMSRTLKILARELECPVLVLSQLSRTLESRVDRRPMMSDLRESGAIEQDADIVAFLYRDEVYNPGSPDMGQAELLVSKHRAGATGTVRLAWIPTQTRFANLQQGNQRQ